MQNQNKKPKVIYYLDCNRMWEPWRVEKEKQEREIQHEEKLRQNDYKPIDKNSTNWMR